jgi:hypothetical protein
MIGSDNCIVRRVQEFPFETVGYYSLAAIVVIANYAAPTVLARNLAAFVVKCIAVAISCRVAKFCHSAIVFDPAQLTIIRDIAPD